MRLGWLIGLLAAAFAHALVVLFGGIFFLHDDTDHASVQAVDLLSDVDTAEEKKEEKPKEVFGSRARVSVSEWSRDHFEAVAASIFKRMSSERRCP